jgi:hypothetical protein
MKLKPTRINISTPSSPSYVNKYTSATHLNGAQDIEISGSYAYVTALNRLTVLDISNTAVAPALVTGFNGGTFMDDPRGLAVSGNYAYVAVNDNVAATDHLTVVDITTPASPAIAGSLLPNAQVWLANGLTGLEQSHNDVDVSGSYIYTVGSVSDNSRGAFHVAEITSAHAAITKDELNATIASGNVWTGSDFDGSSATPYCNTSSTDWRATTATPEGTTGDLVKTTRQWTKNSTTTACNTSNRLYCIQQ